MCAVKTPVSFRDGRFFDGTHRERFEIYREGRLKADAGARSFNTHKHTDAASTRTHTQTQDTTHDTHHCTETHDIQIPARENEVLLQNLGHNMSRQCHHISRQCHHISRQCHHISRQCHHISRQCRHISRHVTNKCDIFLVVEHALSGGEEMVDKG